MHKPQAAEPEILGNGGSRFVWVDNCDTHLVLKSYEVWKNGRCYHRFEPVHDGRACLEREAKIYERLGSHPRILEYNGQIQVADNVLALKLEGRKVIFGLISMQSPPGAMTRLNMAIQIASGMTYLHRRGVFHCDFGCRNIFLIKPWTVKIGDFGGSKLDDQAPFGAEEVRYELPLRGREWEQRSYDEREPFVLGCAIYEIVAWEKPFAQFGETRVEENYTREVFPDTKGILAGKVIYGCWKEQLDSAEDVVAALGEEQSMVP